MRIVAVFAGESDQWNEEDKSGGADVKQNRRPASSAKPSDQNRSHVTNQFCMYEVFSFLSIYPYFFYFWWRATRLYTPICRSVRPSVHPISLSVTLYFLRVFTVFGLTVPAQMIK